MEVLGGHLVELGALALYAGGVERAIQPTIYANAGRHHCADRGGVRHVALRRDAVVLDDALPRHGLGHLRLRPLQPADIMVGNEYLRAELRHV